MKVPVPPPASEPALDSLESFSRFQRLVRNADATSEYRPWDTFRHVPPPPEAKIEEWWAATRQKRRASARPLPLTDSAGHPFTYNLPDEVLQLSDRLERRAAGTVGTAERVHSDRNRNQYLVSSLMEEAISSSQLEGAVTSRVDAKRMLESGRSPRNLSERMIVNNYTAMSMLRDRLDQPMTPELICAIHAVVTEGTLDDPRDAGRIQTDDSQRVRIFGDGDQLLHIPPPAKELPGRMAALCSFLSDDSRYMSPSLKALTAHFMLGYDHYFADGNGRTARAVFYWVMLREGFWLTEYLTVSKLLKEGPAKYARSFLLTEDDDGDLTHFFLFHLGVIHRALDQLDSYLDSKTAKTTAIRRQLSANRDLNYRQIDLLDRAARTPSDHFDIRSHARAHRVSDEAARKDLHALEELGYLVRSKSGRRYVWSAHPQLEFAILSDQRKQSKYN